jgi:hypothetical protein
MLLFSASWISRGRKGGLTYGLTYGRTNVPVPAGPIYLSRRGALNGDVELTDSNRSVTCSCDRCSSSRAASATTS